MVAEFLQCMPIGKVTYLQHHKWLVLWIFMILTGASTCSAVDRALIIGIENYRDDSIRPVLGAENDARAIEQLAIRSFAFPAGSVKLLLGRDTSADNIRQKVRSWLISGTKPGDRVLLFYAGHGTQIADRNKDESDGLDEAIVPFDFDVKLRSNLILDDEIDTWLRELQGRRVLMMFDSCYSGTISRSENDNERFSRFLPLGKVTIGENRNSQDNPFVNILSNRRDLEPVGRTGIDKDSKDAVIISAAQSYQTAFGFPVSDNVFRGALTYLFEETISQNPSQKIEQLEIQLRSGMENLMTDLNERGIMVVQPFYGNGQTKRFQVPEVEILSNCGRGDTALFSISESATCKLGNPRSTNQVALKMLDKKQTYLEDEEFHFVVKLTQPSFLYVLVFSADDVATCVFPSSSDKNNSLAAGEHIFPRKTALPIVARPPWGRDVWVVLATKKPLQLGGKSQQYSWAEVFRTIGVSELKGIVNSATRGAGEADLTGSLLGPGDWQTTSLVIDTRSK